MKHQKAQHNHEQHGAREQQRIHPLTRERAHVRDEEKESDSNLSRTKQRPGFATLGVENGRYFFDGAGAVS